MLPQLSVCSSFFFLTCRPIYLEIVMKFHHRSFSLSINSKLWLGIAIFVFLLWVSNNAHRRMAFFDKIHRHSKNVNYSTKIYIHYFKNFDAILRWISSSEQHFQCDTFCFRFVAIEAIKIVVIFSHTVFHEFCHDNGNV